MHELISADQVHVRLAAADAEGVLTRMARALLAGGRVLESFPDAVVEREAAFPTGLPVGCGVAIPHTDTKHVLEDAIAIATLAKPVRFGEMGGEGDMPVSVVIMLALTASGNHMSMLKKVMAAIQDDEFLDAITSAETPAEVADLAREALPAVPA